MGRDGCKPSLCARGVQTCSRDAAAATCAPAYAATLGVPPPQARRLRRSSWIGRLSARKTRRTSRPPAPCSAAATGSACGSRSCTGRTAASTRCPRRRRTPRTARGRPRAARTRAAAARPASPTARAAAPSAYTRQARVLAVVRAISRSPPSTLRGEAPTHQQAAATSTRSACYRKCLS